MSLDKVGKLLAMAEGAATEEEAAAFFSKAQTLATAYSITLADARSAVEKKREEPTRETVTVGQRGKHVNKHLCGLWIMLSDVNDLKINMAHNSTYVVLFGMPSDIANAKSQYAVVVPQMVKFAEDWLRTDEWRDETVWRAKKRYVEYGYTTYYGAKGYWEEDWGQYPITKQAARASFYEGYTSRLRGVLMDARDAGIREADEHFHAEDVARGAVLESVVNGSGGESRAELVLKAKEVAVSEYYDKTSTARGSWRGGSRSNGTSSSARRAGQAAAARTSLGGGRAVGGGSRALTG